MDVLAICSGMERNGVSKMTTSNREVRIDQIFGTNFLPFFHYKDVKFSKTKFDYFVFTFRKTTHSLIIPYICMLHKHHFSKFNIGNDFALWV